MPRLQDKVAIVTGGSQGIGAETVRQFLQEGATVHSADLAPTQVPEHARLHHYEVDVTDEIRVQDFVNEVLATDGRVDLIGRPNDSVYNAGKHALVGLIRSLTVAYAHSGVRFNTVNPGPIDTDFLRALDPELSLEGEKRMAASVPAARVGTAAEVAAAVVFLACDESTYVNGVSIAVDGGKAAGTMGWDRYNMEFELAERHWAQGQGS